MKEIELSVMFHNNRSTKLLRSLLTKFESKQNVKVNLTVLSWDEAWAELIKVALYGSGPDISEIGNTWVSDFARMQALSPFTPADVRSIGGADSYLPALWKSGLVYGQSQIWAIPWLADTRLLFFRRDILEESGIHEEKAFESHEATEKTLTQLKAKGVKIPWVIPTVQTRMTMHHVASWIWGAGGHFLSADGKKSLLSEPETLEGLYKYFSLVRFLEPEARAKHDVESDSLFWSGDAAVTLSGSWLMAEESIPEEVSSNTGFVSPPGIPFVGGSHLVLWKHSRKRSDSLALIQYLNSPVVQNSYNKEIGLLPANREVLSSPSFSGDLRYNKLVKRLETGRSFRSVPLWGMVENRLSGVLSSIWDDLLGDPNADITKTVEERIFPLHQRLNITLQES